MEIFNILIKYEVKTEIPTVELTDKYWTSKVDNLKATNADLNLLQINEQILILVSSHLAFGKKQLVTNPNQLRKSVAHCVGYASLHASLFDYYCKKSEYKISHVRGKIYLLGYDLTKLTKSKFFKDHDFVRIRHKVKGQEYYTDGSIYDYIKISRIAIKA